MMETETALGQNGSGTDAGGPQALEIELYLLYQRRLKVPKGSDEYQRIQERIDVILDSMDAHRELFRMLWDGPDLRRFVEKELSEEILWQRIQQQINELLATDLTFTEMVRLGRLIDAQIKPLRERLEKPRESQPRCGKSSS